jgi:oligosaccharide repeat unit polymerase
MSAAAAARASRHVQTQHVHVYLWTWVGYFALLLLLPVRYGTLQSTIALFGLLSWAILSALVAYATALFVGSGGGCADLAPDRLGQPLKGSDLRRLIRLSLVLSMLGFFSLAYDRLVLQGIDFSHGIAVARELWRESGEGRAGVSSTFSVVGYLFGFTFFVGTTLAHLHWEVLPRRLRREVILGATVLVLANSLLSGGRSTVLVQLACVAAVGAMRATLGKPMLPGRGLRIWLGVTLGLIVSIGYSIYVFSARAEAGRTLPEIYAIGTLETMGGQPTEAFYMLAELPPPLATTAQFATIASAYVTHSYGTFESVLEIDLRPGSVSFAGIRYLLAKVGIARPDTEEVVLSGRFLPMPGSLWYDFGWLGFYLSGVILGLLIGVVPRLLGWRAGGGIALCAASLILLTGLLAPLMLAIDILVVPFLVLGFFLIDLLNRLSGGPTNWIFVSRTLGEAHLSELSERQPPIPTPTGSPRSWWTRACE